MTTKLDLTTATWPELAQLIRDIWIEMKRHKYGVHMMPFLKLPKQRQLIRLVKVDNS